MKYLITVLLSAAFVTLTVPKTPALTKTVVHNAKKGQSTVQSATPLKTAQPQPETKAVEIPQPVTPPSTHMELMAAAGISPEDYGAADYIINNESRWCPTKWEGEIGIGCPAYHGTPASESVGYGLCQSTAGWKMASAGEDWQTNPVTQLKWCNSYAQTCVSWRPYCGWQGAKQYWSVHRNW